MRLTYDGGHFRYLDERGRPIPVPRWDEPSLSFVADDEGARRASSIRELDEAVTRRQFGYTSVDEYYAGASSDQRLPSVRTPLLLLNACAEITPRSRRDHAEITPISRRDHAEITPRSRRDHAEMKALYHV